MDFVFVNIVIVDVRFIRGRVYVKTQIHVCSLILASTRHKAAIAGNTDPTGTSALCQVDHKLLLRSPYRTVYHPPDATPATRHPPRPTQ